MISARWVFPRLFHSRVPRYEAIARPHGYTVTSHEVAAVRDEQDFLDLVENAIARKANESAGVAAMPMVAHNDLPTFERLRQEGQTILEPGQRPCTRTSASCTSALLNMMPDAALAATERQFFRLVGESNPIAQFYMHPFTLQELPRGEQAQAHIERYYDSFEQIRAEGLDALIITGANVTHPDLSQEPFWEPLREVFDWAQENVTSVLCSCLATHAAMQFHHGQKRRALPAKRWGVFPHRVIQTASSAGERRQHAVRRAAFALQ